MADYIEGIERWTDMRFRRWAAQRIGNHHDRIDHLERVLAAQNVIVADLRLRIEHLDSESTGARFSHR